MNEFSNDIETGLLKMELVSPMEGFGFDIYPKIYDKKISTNSDFLVAFDQWLLMIWSDGLSATIKHYLTKV